MSEAPPDWYPDPYAFGLDRYWDGAAWTGHVREAAEGADREDAAATRLDGVPVRAYLVAMILPVAGVVLGIARAIRQRDMGTNHGLLLVVLSLGVSLFWLGVVASVSGLT